MGVILETMNLTKYFGLVRAADDLSVRVDDGELVGIVGPNGSGKTTFLNLITGYVQPTRGSIRYRGRDITGLPPQAVTTLGIARSFQIPQLYTSLTVLENMLVALATRAGRSQEFWRPLRDDRRTEEAVRILGQFGFKDAVGQAVASLAEGERKLLDVALSFALAPSLLLLDEPTSGVSAKDKFEVMDRLVGVLKGTGVTTAFVEHDLDVVTRYAERMLVFEEGKVIADGVPEVVLADPAMKSVILGTG